MVIFCHCTKKGAHEGTPWAKSIIRPYNENDTEDCKTVVKYLFKMQWFPSSQQCTDISVCWDIVLSHCFTVAFTETRDWRCHVAKTQLFRSHRLHPGVRKWVLQCSWSKQGLTIPLHESPVLAGVGAQAESQFRHERRPGAAGNWSINEAPSVNAASLQRGTHWFTHGWGLGKEYEERRFTVFQSVVLMKQFCTFRL